MVSQLRSERLIHSQVDRPAHYSWYVAGVLMVANLLAFIDRSVLSLLIEPIKQDLGVNDTAMGLLHGFAFSLFYAVLGIPIARLADRFNRRNIIMIGVGFWSIMTAVCGLAKSYSLLFLARVGVGAGEASLSPSAYSLLADYFSPRYLPVALGLFAAGIYLGNGIAIIGGGHLMAAMEAAGVVTIPLLGDVQPWQAVFLIIGACGIPVVLLLLSISEPARTGVSTNNDIPFKNVLRYVRKNLRCYLSLMLGFSLMILLGYGSGAWWPAFFQRTYGWSFAEIGTYFGLAVLIFGTAGSLAGGWLASWLRGRGYADANIRAAMIGAALLTPATIAAPLSPSGDIALVFIAMINFCAGIPFGGGYAAIQEATPARMRAQVSAIFLLAINLIGVGLGPVFIGLMTDFVFKDSASLRYALSAGAVFVSPLAFAVVAWGLPAYRQTVSRVDQWKNL